MSRALAWHPQALRDLRRLDRQIAARVIAAVERYASTESGDIVRLTGYTPPTWRLRVGDWRVLFRFEADGAIRVVGVLHRGEAYR